MTPTQLSTLTSAEWKTLLGDDTTLGIAYSLELSDTTDKADIDSLTLNVDMKGTWAKAMYGDEYTYAYSNKSINYPLGNITFANGMDIATEADIKKLFTQRSVVQ